jgi:hypothetical protein
MPNKTKQATTPGKSVQDASKGQGRETLPDKSGKPKEDPATRARVDAQVAEETAAGRRGGLHNDF